MSSSPGSPRSERCTARKRYQSQSSLRQCTARRWNGLLKAPSQAHTLRKTCALDSQLSQPHYTSDRTHRSCSLYQQDRLSTLPDHCIQMDHYTPYLLYKMKGPGSQLCQWSHPLEECTLCILRTWNTTRPRSRHSLLSRSLVLCQLCMASRSCDHR